MSKTISQVLEEFKREFGIHFSPSELQFAEGFIKSSLEAILMSMPLRDRNLKIPNRDSIVFEMGYNKAVKEVKEWRTSILK